MQSKFARYAALGGAAIVVVGASTYPALAHKHADSPAFEALKKARLSMLKCKHYRVLMKSTDASGKATPRTMEVIPPNRYHMKGGTTEMIIVPEGSFANRNGKWTRLPMDMSKSLSKLSGMQDGMDEDSAKHTTVKLIGPSVWHGSPATLYSIAYSDNDMKSNSKVWVRLSDNLPVHSESTMDMEKFSIGGKTFGGGSTKTELDYDYTTPVTITAPK